MSLKSSHENSNNRAAEITAFSLTSVPMLAAALTDVERNLLDAIWQRQVSVGTPFPKRGLFSIIGKRFISEIIDGMIGRLLIETREGTDACYTLTVQGALLSSCGSILSTLLVRLLDLVKALNEEDSFVKQVDNATVQKRLDLSASDLRQLFSFLKVINLRQMPFYLSGWANDELTWFITITDEVLDLACAPSSTAFLDKRLPLNEAQVALDIDVGIRALNEHGTLHPAFLPPNVGAMIPSTARANYVVRARLAALRELRNANFDCTRLICLCEELNECADRANAHAVIMLTRALLDHVPPVFGYRTFKEVASNYGDGGRSLKLAFERLEQHMRKVADRMLHMPIRDKEVAPEMKEVDFSAELESVLAEFCRVLK